MSRKVFLSHNSTNKPAVEKLALRLQKEEDIEVWFDEWDLIPGQRWQEKVEAAIRECDCGIILIGKGDSQTDIMGPWHDAEMRVLINRQISKRDSLFAVIPVLLPGAKRGQCNALSDFLMQNHWVEFIYRLEEDAPLRRLLAGIRGERPGPPAEVVAATDEYLYRDLEVSDVAHAKNSSSQQRVPVRKTLPISLPSGLVPTLEETNELAQIIAEIRPSLEPRFVAAAFAYVVDTADGDEEAQPVGYSKLPSLQTCLRSLRLRPVECLMLFVQLCLCKIEHANLNGAESVDEWQHRYWQRIIYGGTHLDRIAIEKDAEQAFDKIINEAQARWRIQIVAVPQIGINPKQYNLYYTRREESESKERTNEFEERSNKQAYSGTLENLKNEFAYFFEEACGMVSEQDQIAMVELILPRELLCVDTSQWEVDRAGVPTYVGKCYSTALRSYERGYQVNYRTVRAIQKKKWPPHLTAPSAGWSWVNVASDLSNNLFEQWKAMDTKAVAALTLVPQGNINAESHRIVERIIAAGISVAVWLAGHESSECASAERLIQRLGPCLHQLPARLLNWNADDLDAFPCTGISLLWDNPGDPLPQLLPLQAPE